jgi:hypothetical protein
LERPAFYFFTDMAKAKEKKESTFVAPFLPSLDTLPDRHDLVAHVNSYPAYKHNAKTLMKDQELCCDVIERRLKGQGKKRIARECGISNHSVQAIWDAAEKAGILAPLKERLSKKAGEIIEDSLDEIHTRVLAGTMPDNVLPVVMGVVADKKAAWDGQPGLIIEHRGPILNIEAVNQFFDRAPENQSGVLPVQVVDIQGPSDAGTSPGTCPALLKEGGRGSGNFPAGGNGDVSANGPFCPKESSS